MAASSRTRDLRRKLRQALPATIFEPQPARGWLAYGETVLAVLIAVGIVRVDPPWWVKSLLALVLGQIVSSVVFAAHEAMHHSVFRSRWANRLLGAVGFAPFLVTPGLWNAWHVQAHHGNTNRPERDPDRLQTVAAYRTSWLARVKARMAPGHRHPLSVISLAFMFTLQGQAFLWSHCDDPLVRHRVSLHRWRERFLCSVLGATWVGLSVYLGVDALFIVVLPMLTANATLMLYISTQHWLRPLVNEDNPVVTTLSVAVPKFFDWIHFGFSHHQEHHLFPHMSHKFAPLVRDAVRTLEPEALALLPMKQALVAVFSTPGLYRDDVTLSHEDESEMVDLSLLGKSLGLPRL